MLGYLRLTRTKARRCERLLEIAVSLGADVPFFLFGGRALGVSRGDEIYPLADVAKHSVLVIARQDIHVPTPEAFRWVKAPLLAEDARPLTIDKIAPQTLNFGSSVLCAGARR